MNTKYRIALVEVPPPETVLVSGTTPSLALAFLAPPLLKEGYRVKIFDGVGTKNRVKTIIQESIEFNPNFVAITLTSAARFNGIRIIRALKRAINPLIIGGGSHFANTGHDSLTQISDLDIVVKGYGEKILPQIITNFNERKDLSSIDGILYRAKDGSIIENRDDSNLPHINDLDMPAYHIFNHPRYSFKHFGTGLKSIGIISSRGCHYNCIFCSAARKKIQYLNSNHFVDILQYLYEEFGYRAFDFWDDTFTTNKQHVQDICKEILNRRLDIKWVCCARVDTVDYKLLSLLKEAGCTTLGYGIESASQKTLNTINKNINIKQAREAIDMSIQLGFKLILFYIINFPYDTWEDTRKTLDMVLEMKKNKNVFPTYSFAMIFPNTRLEAIAKEENAFPKDFSWNKPYFNIINRFANHNPYMPLYSNPSSPLIKTKLKVLWFMYGRILAEIFRRSIKKYILKIFDYLITFLLVLITLILLPLYVAYIIVSVKLYKFYLKNIKKQNKLRNLLLLSEAAPFAELKQAGQLKIFKEWLHDDYFAHMYVLLFNASRTQWHRFEDKITFIDIGKHFRILKKISFYNLYTLLSAITLFFNIMSLRFFILREIQVIRGANPYHMGLSAIILGKITGIPHCISVHSDNDANYELMKERWKYSHMELFGSRRISQMVMRIVYRNASQVWVIRKYLENEALCYGANKYKIRLFPHSCDSKHYLFPSNANLKTEMGISDKKIVVFVGRIAPENYVMDIPKIAEEITIKRKDIIFIVVGSGPSETDLKSLITLKNLGRYFIFTGWRDNEEIVNYRHMADVNLCLRGGYSLIEAALSGKAIVAYDVDWHSELIKDSHSGFLVAVGRADLVAQKILYLLEHQDGAAAIGARAKERACLNHDYANVTRMKILLYDELIKQFSN